MSKCPKFIDNKPCAYGCDYGEIACRGCGSLRIKYALKIMLFKRGIKPKEPWMDRYLD